MSAQNEFERCRTFINCQLRSNGKGRTSARPTAPLRAVTISRQAGCGAFAVAQELAEYLQTQSPKGEPLWTVFDRNLVEKVLEDHHLPRRLARFMPENWIPEMQDTIDDLFGLHPPSWLLVRQTAETILRLAKMGNVILIGRAANIVTAKLSSVFHIRLVASLERRIHHLQESEHLDRKAAIKLIQREDKGRQRYVRKYYRKDINNPLLYHLVINTDLIRYDRAARLIGDYVIEKSLANATAVLMGR